MHEIVLHAHMAGEIGGARRTQILHGKVRDGQFVFTDHSQGRSAEAQTIQNWHLVEKITEEPDGSYSSGQETRVITLGPGIVYEYDGIRFMNEGGIIFQVGIGFDEKPQMTPISDSLMIGGAMPRTIFQAAEEPGFTLLQ